MTILLRRGTAKSNGFTAHWELTKASPDTSADLTIKVWRPAGLNLASLELAASLKVDAFGHGEGLITYTDHIAGDDFLVDPIPQADLLVYINEDTWAHIALDIFINS